MAEFMVDVIEVIGSKASVFVDFKEDNVWEISNFSIFEQVNFCIFAGVFFKLFVNFGELLLKSNFQLLYWEKLTFLHEWVRNQEDICFYLSDRTIFQPNKMILELHRHKHFHVRPLLLLLLFFT